MEVEWLKNSRRGRLRSIGNTSIRRRSPQHLAAVPTPRLCQSNWFYEPRGESEEILGPMRSIDCLGTKCPALGTREICRLVEINRKRARAADGAPRTRGSMPQAINQPPGPGPQDLLLFAAASADCRAQPRVGQRHYVHPDAARLRLPHGGRGSLQPERLVVEALDPLTGDFCIFASRRRSWRDQRHRFGTPVHVAANLDRVTASPIRS